MKKLLLTLSFLALIVISGLSQTCMPDENVPDTLVGVAPFPFDAELNPMGGISDTACVNEPFEFVFTLVVPDTFAFSGLTFPITGIDLDPETAITNLPNGIDYACNPPTCVFPADTTGCVVLYGTVNDTVGVYDLQISGLVRSELSDLPLSFPNPQLAPGNYFLHVKEEGQCAVSSTQSLAELGVSATARPNPTSGFTQIAINSPINGDFDLIVSNLFGQAVHRERINLVAGANTFDFDASQLPVGMYVYTISDGTRQLSEKLIISRR